MGFIKEHNSHDWCAFNSLHRTKAIYVLFASLKPSNSSTQTFLTFYFDLQNLVCLSFFFSRKYLRDNERHYLARKVRMRKSL